MIRNLFLLLFFCLVFEQSVVAQNAKEEGCIVFKDLEVHHQGVNNLNMKITYHYKANPAEKQYINLLEIRMKVDSVLQNYPNTTDWWEIINKNLTATLMAKYEIADSLASDIEVNWVSGAGVDYGHKYPTRSVTSRTRAGKLYEYFGFRTLHDYKIPFKSFAFFCASGCALSICSGHKGQRLSGWFGHRKCI